MARYKFVGEMYFEAESMDDALAKLGTHFTKLSKDEVSFLTLEGSRFALAEPEFDPGIERAHIVETEDDNG